MYKLSDLLIWQYWGKKRAKATIDLLAGEAERVYLSAVGLASILSIDDAHGWALDLVGRHVGISRSLPAFVARPYFGWAGDDSANPFGVGEWFRVGGQLRDPILMNDEDYRFMIRAKILKNFQIGDIGDIVDSVQFLFGENANAVDGYDMSVVTVILPAAQLNALQMYAIRSMDILRRPIGTKYRFLQVDARKPFGWASDPQAAGFNDGIFSRFLV